jgi:hypothetical protein
MPDQLPAQPAHRIPPSTIKVTYIKTEGTAPKTLYAEAEASCQIHHQGHIPVGHIQLFDRRGRITRSILLGNVVEIDRTYHYPDE